jgi:hypothetical protein
MRTKQADEIVGKIDGRALRVPRAYNGTLTLAQRAAVLRGVADYTTEIASPDADERVSPVDRARARSVPTLAFRSPVLSASVKHSAYASRFAILKSHLGCLCACWWASL